MFGKRILVLVPHPDDEVVACCAALEEAQTQGAEIFALYLTHGCIAEDALWPWHRQYHDIFTTIRLAEAEATAAFLNIKPVGFSNRSARYVWKELKAVQHEIEMAIAAHQIDQIWVPAYEGGNPDHDALNAIGHVLQSKVSVLEFAEYNFFQGKAHSQEFPSTNGTEHIIHLTEAQQKKKLAALSIYKSERKNLNYVDVQRECYRPLADYDYSKPPHPGTLWYARFQWVPFKHPRVDFTKPQDVCSALTHFLGRITV
ncbi:MAG: PIG-L family deacetylase [Alphaproteobacteria bacterium]